MTCFFYLGVMAFADGLYPIKVPTIASSHGRTSLPIAWATLLSSLTKWLFCLLTSTCLVNKDMYLSNEGSFDNKSNNFALLFGAAIYLSVNFLPNILHD